MQNGETLQADDTTTAYGAHKTSISKLARYAADDRDCRLDEFTHDELVAYLDRSRFCDEAIETAREGSRRYNNMCGIVAKLPLHWCV